MHVKPNWHDIIYDMCILIYRTTNMHYTQTVTTIVDV